MHDYLAFQCLKCNEASRDGLTSMIFFTLAEVREHQKLEHDGVDSCAEWIVLPYDSRHITCVKCDMTFLSRGRNVRPRVRFPGLQKIKI